MVNLLFVIVRLGFVVRLFSLQPLPGVAVMVISSPICAVVLLSVNVPVPVFVPVTV